MKQKRGFLGSPAPNKKRASVCKTTTQLRRVEGDSVGHRISKKNRRGNVHHCSVKEFHHLSSSLKKKHAQQNINHFPWSSICLKKKPLVFFPGPASCHSGRTALFLAPSGSQSRFCHPICNRKKMKKTT